MRTVLIANRGEIAVRVVRACRDAGLRSAVVYAGPDRDAPAIQMADEALPLGGDGPADSYLDATKVLAAAARAGADALHPGYGFLSENADFAQAVIDAGLTWIGPPPAAMRRLGDKVAARQIARRAGAPLAAGTADPVGSAAEVISFAQAHGLPVAIKAVFGGGGRGMKVARTYAEIAECFESAAREAERAFGRAECFVERYLDRARHVETQCLADSRGNVAVISTRDCSLQRRHQKLVEEAPAPYLTADQQAVLCRASNAILSEAGYVGAGTCEFLLGDDGTISFLEANARLQVEHPVTEEVTGIDLVREMFRIADGQSLGYRDPPVRGHAIEFRINAEDPGRGFVPTPGTVTVWQPPSGPGVRLDSGVTVGSVVDPAWDSLLAKLIITGASREEALRRAARALAEFRVGGVATVLPFHQAVVADPAFAPEPGAKPPCLGVHTRWVETEFTGTLAPSDQSSPATGPQDRELITVEVNGRRVEVSLPAVAASGAAGRPAAPGPSRRARPGGTGPAAAGGPELVSPMQGTVVKVEAGNGQRVAAGDLVVVLEAMKMEQPVAAHRDGVVTNLAVQPGTAVTSGALICEISS